MSASSEFRTLFELHSPERTELGYDICTSCVEMFPCLTYTALDKLLTSVLAITTQIQQRL